MKREELEKYISELSPEMQEKARQCKDMQELNAILAENDVELSDDALEAVSGGCSASSDTYNQGDPIPSWYCPDCGSQLYYWDAVHDFWLGNSMRAYCANPNCKSCNNGLWWWKNGGLKKYTE